MSRHSIQRVQRVSLPSMPWLETHVADGEGPSEKSLNGGPGAGSRERRGCCEIYTTLIHRLRYILLIFWFLSGLLCGWFGPQFMHHTKDAFSAPKGTDAYKAGEIYTQLFPHLSAQHEVLVLLHTPSSDISLIQPNTPAYNYALHIETSLQIAFNATLTPDLENAKEYDRVLGYFSMMNTVPLLASKFVSADNQTLYWIVSYNPTDPNIGRDISIHVRDVVSSLDTDETYQLGATGTDLLYYDINVGSEKDMLHSDTFILPTAMFVLCLYLKSLRLMILPLLCVVLSIVSAFSMMLPFSIYTFNVASFAPAIMMSLTLALSIDYSLFLLIRYRSEILSGFYTDAKDAVDQALKHSGEVIGISGITLGVTFASLIVFPMDFLSSIGLGASLTIVSCLLVNLTFTPAMLYSFPSFFSNFTIHRWLRKVLPKRYCDDIPKKPFVNEESDAFLPKSRSISLMRSAVDEEEEEQEREEKMNDLNNLHLSLNPNVMDDSRFESSHRMSYDVGATVPAQSAQKPIRGQRLLMESSQSSVGINSGNDRSTPMHSLSLRGSDIGIVSETFERKKLSQHPYIVRLRKKQLASFWYKSSVLTTTNWCSVVLIVLILLGMIPFLISSIDMTYTIDESQLLPRHSDSVKVYHQVEEYLQPGLLARYQLVVVVDENAMKEHEKTQTASTTSTSPLFSPLYWNATSSLIQSIVSSGLLPNTSLTSIVFPNGFFITPQQSQLLLATCPLLQLSCAYQVVFEGLVSTQDMKNLTQQSVTTTSTTSTTHASLITMVTPFQPLGDDSQAFLASLRAIISQHQTDLNAQAPGVISLYITGGAVDAIDAVHRIYELFPYIIASTIGIVLILVGGFFRSLFVPIRLIFTLAIPMVYTYGIAVMVFQQGHIVNWMHLSVLKGVHAVYWLEPVLAFSICIGLALDYDIFLFSRIVEYRKKGYTNTSAIRIGIYHTGSIITGAGVIMSLAFFGLMLSSVLAMNEFGFMLCFAVLFDTFVIRTMLVPAILHLTGELNWFPSRMPLQLKGDLEQDGEEGLELALEQEPEYSFR